MFCPNCGAEYVPGITRCADCSVELETDPPPTPPLPREYGFVPILDTYNQGDIAVISSLLQDAGVEFFFQGEHFAAVNPLIQPARLFVQKERVEEVKEILASLSIRYLGVRGSSEES